MNIKYIKSVVFVVFLFQFSNLFAQFAINAGSDQDDRGHGITKDVAGNVYVTGHFTQLASQNLDNLDSFNDSWDIFIAKYNSSGVHQWSKQLGGDAADEGLDIKVVGSYVYVTGYFQNTADFDPSGSTHNIASDGNTEIFIGKYNTSDGSLVWAKSVGASDQDEGRSIAVDGSGNIYLTGFFKNTATFYGSPNISITSPNTFASFIAKFNSSGNVQYAKLLGGSDETYGDEIVVDVSGNAYVTGSFKGTNDFNPESGSSNNLTSDGGFDIFIAKYNSSGNYVWAHRIGGGSDDMGFSLGLDGSNNVYATGYFQGDDVDFDPSGNDNDLSSAGNKDIFIVKFDTDGNFQWADQIGSDQDDEAFSISVDSDGNSCITGYFKSIADFDPSGTFTLTSANNEDTYVARYTNAGALVGASQLAGGADIRGRDVVSDGAGNCCVTGFYNMTVDFDPASPINASDLTAANEIFIDTGVYKIKAFGDRDVFLTCLHDGELPVEMTSFSVTVNTNLAQLNWETATEVNNYGFEIQRSSVSKDWNKVGFVEGYGNSNSPKYYSFTDNSVTQSGDYSYRLKQIDIDGTSDYSDVVNINLSIEEMKYNLNQNYPNPFNPTTTISYTIPEQAHVDLIVYNIFGEEITRLVSETKEIGTYSINFNAENLAAGLYFYTIQTESYTATKKLILLK